MSIQKNSPSQAVRYSKNHDDGKAKRANRMVRQPRESQEQKPKPPHGWRSKEGCGVATARARAARQYLEMQRAAA